jgi:hypothetical protein
MVAEVYTGFMQMVWMLGQGFVFWCLNVNWQVASKEVGVSRYIEPLLKAFKDTLKDGVQTMINGSYVIVLTRQTSKHCLVTMFV